MSVDMSDVTRYELSRDDERDVRRRADDIVIAERRRRRRAEAPAVGDDVELRRHSRTLMLTCREREMTLMRKRRADADTPSDATRR